MLKVTEVARIFNVRPYTVRGWINDGKLPATRLSTGQFRVYESDLAEFANKKYGSES